MVYCFVQYMQMRIMGVKMIIECEFKGSKAILLENSYLKAIILPSIGGKVAFLFSKEKEFELIFQNKEASYKKPTIYDDFGLYDAAGFDDAFPSINKGKIKVGDKEIEYPDHGEIWSGDFSYELNDQKIELHFKSSILPYIYKKTISLNKKELLLEYEIQNIGSEDFPCIWAAHFLINCEENMEIYLPKGTKNVINVKDSDYLGNIGTIHSYPNTLDLDNKVYNLNKVFPKSYNKCEKYYTYENLEEGICGAYYPNKNITYNLKFDKNVFPYIGLWVTEGGFRGDYNCALEPANGFYDSIEIAEKEDKLYILKAGAKLEFAIEIQLQ